MVWNSSDNRLVKWHRAKVNRAVGRAYAALFKGAYSILASHDELGKVMESRLLRMLRPWRA